MDSAPSATFSNWSRKSASKRSSAWAHGATWNEAAVYQIDIPAIPEGRRVILDFHCIGDAVRIFVGGKFFMDHYYNGDPLSIALWRIPASDHAKITLKLLPYSDGLAGRLPDEAKKLAAQAKADGTLEKITITATEQLDLRLSTQFPSHAVSLGTLMLLRNPP